MFRRRRKGLSIALCIALFTVGFFIAHSGARPKLSVTNFSLMWVPSRKTYITEGARFANSMQDELQVLPGSRRDIMVASYNNTAIKEIHDTLAKLSKALSMQLRFLPQFDNTVIEEELRATFGSDIWKLLDHIRAVSKGVRNKLSRIQSIGDISEQVKILSTRVFPRRRRPEICKGCVSFQHALYVHPWSVCKHQGNIDLLVLVTSRPRNVEAREVIRSTWGTYSSQNTANVRVVFLFGKCDEDPEVDVVLLKESQQYHDVLQESYQEGYYNLARKVFGGFRWAVHSCSHARFTMVIADDVFVNVPALLRLTGKYGRTDGFRNHVIGNCRVLDKPYRWPDHKDYISLMEYDQNIFPPYPEGSLFLASNRLVEELIATAADVPYFPRADVYIGLVLNKLGRGCHNVEGLLLRHTQHIPTQPFFGLHPLTPAGLKENYIRLLMRSLSSLFRPI